MKLEKYNGDKKYVLAFTASLILVFVISFTDNLRTTITNLSLFIGFILS